MPNIGWPRKASMAKKKKKEGESEKKRAKEIRHIRAPHLSHTNAKNTAIYLSIK